MERFKVIFDQIVNIDHSIFMSLNGLDVPAFVDTFFMTITNVKVLFIFALLLLVLLAITLKKKSIGIIILLLLGTGVGDYTGAKMKRAFGVPRPCHPSLDIDAKFLVGKKTSPSFPSNHAINWGFISIYLFLVLKGLGELNRFRYFMVLFGVLTAYSRIAVGVHYPMDISFGYLYGALLAIFFAKINSRITHSK